MSRNSLLHFVAGRPERQTALLAEERFWDAIVRENPIPDDAIDPALAATIHRVYTLDDAPLPDAAFAARLESELLRARPRGADAALATTAAGAGGLPERLAAPGHRNTAARRDPLTDLAAMAALLAIVLVSVFVTLRLGPLASREQVSPPLVLAPGITDEKLLIQARFDSFGDGVLSASILRWVLQPGAEMSMGRQNTSGVGPSAYRVESGTLTVVPDDAIAVTRDGASTVTVAPEGTPISLFPGDQGFAPAGVTSTWRNDGPHPVRIMEATFASRELPPPPEGVLVYQVISEWPQSKPDHPITIRVIQVTLHPEGTLTADTVPGLAMLKVEAGRLVAIDVDGVGNPLPPVELGQATRFLQSFPPGRVFRSGNDKPVALLLVTIRNANLLGTDG